MDGSTRTRRKTKTLGASAQVAPSPQIAQDFDWPVANDAEQFLRERIAVFLERNTFARQLADQMLEETATDLFEWVDHLVLDPEEEQALRRSGFVPNPQGETPKGETVYECPRSTLARVILRPGTRQSPSALALRPESVADFMARHDLPGEPEGEPFSRYRRVVVAEEDGTQLELVERRAYLGFVPAPLQRDELVNIIKAREL